MNGIVKISENICDAFDGHTSTVITHAQDTCPGLLVFTEFFTSWNPRNSNGTHHCVSQSFLPDGYIDHDEDDKPFIRSRQQNYSDIANNINKAMAARAVKEQAIKS